MARATPVLTAGELQSLADEVMPAYGIRVVKVEPETALFEVGADSLQARPGGTVSGPAIFAFADVAAYLVISAYLGPALESTLSSANVTFLEAPEPETLTAAVRLVRLGRRSAVLTAEVADGTGHPVALATLHFAVPGRRVARAPGGPDAGGQPAAG